MKAIIKNQTRKNRIRLAIAAACVVLLIGPSVAVAGEPLMLASLNRITPLDTFDEYDPFPEYHREARIEDHEKEIQVDTDVIEEIKRAENTDAVDTAAASVAWVGGKAIDGYEILNGDYGQLLTGLLSE